MRFVLCVLLTIRLHTVHGDVVNVRPIFLSTTVICTGLHSAFSQVWIFKCLWLPGSVDELVCVCPVREKVAGLHIVQSDVHISEGLWEKVVNLPRHIQNIAHTEKHRHKVRMAKQRCTIQY